MSKRMWNLYAALATLLMAASVSVAQAATSGRSTERVDSGNADAVIVTTLQSSKAYHRASEDVVVQVSFTNTSDVAVTLPQWLFDADDVDRSFLKVTRGGSPVTYTAALVKRAAPTAGELMVLSPGQSRTASYELSSAFDLGEGGTYAVSFVGAAQNAMTTQARASASIVIGVEADPFRSLVGAVDYQKAAGAGGVSYTGRCTASEKSSLVTALTDAEVYAGNAVTYLSGTPSATTRYSTWFGAFSTANWNTVKTHFTNIRSVYNTQPIVFDCGCSKKNTYAYVYPSQPYKIYLCGAFWSAPATGTDSKAGTLVHETSHFTVVAGTQDYAYGQSAAKALALSNPAQAIMNADSHEYFAENTPAQP